MPTNTLERQREENARLVTVLLDVSSTLGQLIKQEKPDVTSKRQIAKLAGLCKEIEDVTAAQQAIGHQLRPPAPPFWLDLSSRIRRAIPISGNTAESVGLVRDPLLFVIRATVLCGFVLVAFVFDAVLVAFLVRVYDWLILPVWPYLERILVATDVLVLESDWAKWVGEAVTQAFECISKCEYNFDACCVKQGRPLMSTVLVETWLACVLLPKGYCYDC